MAFKPNYNQQRSDRNRLKQAKKDEKLRRLQEGTAERKAADGTGSAAEDNADTTA